MKYFLWGVGIICLAWVVIFSNLVIGSILGLIGVALWVKGLIELDNPFNNDGTV